MYTLDRSQDQLSGNLNNKNNFYENRINPCIDNVIFQQSLNFLIFDLTEGLAMAI